VRCRSSRRFGPLKSAAATTFSCAPAAKSDAVKDHISCRPCDHYRRAVTKSFRTTSEPPRYSSYALLLYLPSYQLSTYQPIRRLLVADWWVWTHQIECCSKAQEGLSPRVNQPPFAAPQPRPLHFLELAPSPPSSRCGGLATRTCPQAPKCR